MKISILPAAALCATFAAIVLMPVHPAAASIALTSTGILCLFAADYGRTVRPLGITERAGNAAEIIAFEPARRSSAALRDAA